MIYKTLTIISCLLFVALPSCRNVDAKEVKSQIDTEVAKSKGKKSKKEHKLSPLDTTKLSSVSSMYDVNAADLVLSLPDELKEISGLSFEQTNNQFLANNDEEGFIYHLDMDGQIVKKVDFGKDGDYEGIERVGDAIVVCKSKGDLYFYDVNTEETLKVKTDLKDRNNVEGLTYDLDHDLLLLACKGAALTEKKSKHEKFIYAYNLKLEVLHEEPFLIMRDAVHLSYVEYHIKDINQEEKEDLQKRVKDFAPSGIAISPVNHDLYVLSARGSFAVVYDENHDFKDILFFDEKIVPQPEGICFNPQGDLYVSTEGTKSEAKIFKYPKL